jgi:UrcA family protein
MRVHRLDASHRAAATAAALFLGLTALASGAEGRTAAQVATIAAGGIAAERVDYSDLNLASARGQRALLRRLDAAARRVCQAPSGRARLDEMRAARHCVQDSLRRAVGEVGHPEVTALFRSRTLPVGPS